MPRKFNGVSVTQTNQKRAIALDDDVESDEHSGEDQPHQKRQKTGAKSLIRRSNTEIRVPQQYSRRNVHIFKDNLHAIGSQKWWRSLIEHDEFWTMFKTWTPQTILKKRLVSSFDIITDLNQSSDTTNVALPTAKPGRNRKSAIESSTTSSNTQDGVDQSSPSVPVSVVASLHPPGVPPERSSQPSSAKSSLQEGMNLAPHSSVPSYGFVSITSKKEKSDSTAELHTLNIQLNQTSETELEFVSSAPVASKDAQLYGNQDSKPSTDDSGAGQPVVPSPSEKIANGPPDVIEKQPEKPPSPRKKVKFESRSPSPESHGHEAQGIRRNLPRSSAIKNEIKYEDAGEFGVEEEVVSVAGDTDEDYDESQR